jgi:hypothetical protein
MYTFVTEGEAGLPESLEDEGKTKCPVSFRDRNRLQKNILSSEPLKNYCWGSESLRGVHFFSKPFCALCRCSSLHSL